MRRNSGIAAIVGLIALVLLPMAALAIAPIAKELPDLRGQTSTSGTTGVVLNLNDYVIDADSRNQATSAQSALTWTDTSSNTNILATNELQVVITAGAAAGAETDTFTVSDGTGNDTAACTLHTTSALLGGPLVDTQIGGSDGALIPYFWAVEGAQTGTLSIPFVLTAAPTTVTLATGFTQTCLYAASQVVADTANPLTPYAGTVTKVATDSTAPLGVSAGNLSIDADINGLSIVPLAGFAGWARVTVTRQVAAGDYDSYTVAIADFLNGSNDNLIGLAIGDSTISTVAENYNFEELSMMELIGFDTSAAWNSASATDRHNAYKGESTNWMVRTSVYSGGDTSGLTLPNMEITSTGKPAATYPGATDGNALKLTFNQNTKQNIYMEHKGIPKAQYSAGDVVNFSVNTYFDLGYTGTAADDAINEPTNGLSFIMNLGTFPGYISQNMNVIASAPAAGSMDSLRPTHSTTGAKYGFGASQSVNPIAFLAGKWTRQEVSFRVPEFGQSIVGSAGTGNVADGIGLGAQLYIGRNLCETSIVNQVVWLDNIAITRCPGALALAYGAIEVPMISSGLARQFVSGGAVATAYAGVYDAALPAAIALGQTIFGSFSQGGTGSTELVTGRDPSAFFGATPVAMADAKNTAKAGFLELTGNTDAACIGAGDTGVALAFPTLDDGFRALVLGPAGLTTNAFTAAPATVCSNVVKVQTPVLDLRLANAAAVPGLRVEDANFGGGTGGGADGDDGYLNPNKVVGNISGVFGLRWFTKSNAPSVNFNPKVVVQLLNGDQFWGLVATRDASVLPSDDNSAIADDAWSDDFAAGSFTSFNSNMYYYDILLNNQTGGRAAIYGKTPAATLTNLSTNNPGAQMAVVTVVKTKSGEPAVITSYGTTGANGFKGIFSTDTTTYPGYYGSAVLSVDELHLLSVRDTGTFYDEALQ